MRLSILLACGSLFAIYTADIAADERAAKAESTVRVVLENKNPFEASGVARIRKVDVGVDNVILLRLVNTSPFELDLREAKTSCGCIELRSELAVLSPDDECDLELRLHPEKNYAGSTWQQYISFEPKKRSEKTSPRVTIALIANLSGVFALRSDRILFVADEGVDNSSQNVVREIAICTTSPVSADTLELGGGDLLNLIDMELRPSDKEDEDCISILTMTMRSNDIPEAGFHTNLHITDPTTEQSRTVAISGIRRSPIRVVPTTLVCQSATESDSYVASGLLIRTRVNSTPTTDKTSSDSRPYLVAKVGNQAIPVEVVQSAENFCRIKLSVSDETYDAIFSDTTQVNCDFEITWHGARRTQTVVLKLSTL
ncbi:MAG: hypothetical protein AAGD07_23215 [Planctomycetota bacterium]